MLEMSQGLRAALSEGNALARAVVRLRDGTTLELGGGDIMLGGATFSRATSSAQSFDVGAAITGRCTLRLRNDDRHLNHYDFASARFSAYVGAVVDGETEWLRMGTYWVEPIETMGETVNMVGLDNMILLERAYSEVRTAYPATLAEIVADACAACGVELATKTFPHSDYTVGACPDDTDATCLEVVGWAAQAAGCFADVDAEGRLRIRWYNTRAWDGEGDLDGGTFDTTTTRYSDGDNADGGGFMDGGDTIDGGQFAAARYVGITDLRRITAAINDTTVTGVAVTAASERTTDGSLGADGEQVLDGTDGYVLNVADNPLIEYGRAKEVARMVGEHVNGMTFRALTASSISDPAIEAGDAILVTDRVQDTYRTYATHVTWSTSGTATVECRAAATSDMETRKRRTPAEVAALDYKRDLSRDYGARFDTFVQATKDYLMHDPDFRQAVWDGITGGSWSGGDWSGGGWSGGSWSGGSIQGADGNWYGLGVDGSGNVVAKMVPSAIEVVTPPDKTTYEVGERIDYSGTTVRLLDGNGEVFTDERYPDGMVPFGELSFPAAVAPNATGEPKGVTGEVYASGDGIVAVLLNLGDVTNAWHEGVDFGDLTNTIGGYFFAYSSFALFSNREVRLGVVTQGLGEWPHQDKLPLAYLTRWPDPDGEMWTYMMPTEKAWFVEVVPDDTDMHRIGHHVWDGPSDAGRWTSLTHDGLWTGNVVGVPESSRHPYETSGDLVIATATVPVEWASPYDGRTLGASVDIVSKPSLPGSGFGGGGGGGAF